ncbi:MAG: carbohydrate binding domain-containing protein [Lachnospiraceae bacterium]|nr:carbohydrate binding domain-containing protein [Lachnospiraceae bacterium]
MGQSLTVYKRNGTVRYKLDNYTQLCTVKSAEQKCVLLGEDTVTLKLTSAEPLQFVVGDYMEIFGSVYTLNKFDEPTKTGEREFETQLEFEGLQYKLIAAQYRSADAEGLNPTAEFPLVADMRLAMGVLINNINRVSAPNNEVWTLGECPDTEFKEYSFSRENCLEVLQRLCQDNSCEFLIVPLGNKHYRLDIKQKIGSLFPAKFTFGRGGGIYQLKRKNINNDDVISRLYVEGGQQNITTKYRNGAQRLRLAVNAESYVEDELAIKAFGVKEASRTYDNIYPHRTGHVTAIVEGDVLSFIDEEMFDLNEKDGEGNTRWLIDGTPAKVKFTGNKNLAGYTFDIHSYDHKTHKFTLVRYEDSRGMRFPSDSSTAYQIEKDAEYVLLDIVMPDDPYVVDAEAELLEKAKADLKADCQPKVSYELELDSMALERAYGSDMGITNIFQLGDLLHIVDRDINVDKAIRLTGFTRDCYSQPYKYKLTLSDTVEVSLIQNILEDIIEHEQEITNLTNKTNVELMRMQWRTTQELLGLVFDADGYFDTTKIRPSSIETMMLSVGNRNGQFIMRDVIVTCNALINGKPNANLFTVQSNNGILQHYAIEENIRTWTVVANTITLTSNGAMFLYAQCPKSGSTCRLILSQNRYATEVGTYYYFLVGVLSSVYNGYRELTTTYGNTRITGRCINCGRIESADKQTYFDLDNSEIGGNIKFRSTSGELLDINELEQQLNDSTSNIEQTLLELQNTLNQLQDQVDGAIEYWFGEGVPTVNTEPAVQWTDDATRESHLGDIYTDTATGMEYRYFRIGRSATVDGQIKRLWVYGWQEIPSTGIGAAIQAANNALDLAGSKAHVYVTANASTPPPATYHTGDLWIMLDTYKIKLCIKDAGSAYKSTDWKDAGYTDDTQANKALQQLTDMASDSIITPAEKIALKDEMANIKVDYSTVKSKAQLVGCSTTGFDAAYSTLLAYTNSILANMSANSTVDKTQYTNNFTAYYTERTDLLNAISSKYTDSAIGSLEIGGTNYIKNSAFMPDTKGWSISMSATNKTSSLSLYNDTAMGNVLRITTLNKVGGGTFSWWYFGTGMQGAGGNITVPDNKLKNGITYTVAFWVKASAAKTLRVGFMDGTAANIVAPLKDFSVNTKWQRVTYTFTANNLSSASTRLYITATEANLPTYLYFTKFVLVEGNKAPEWQPNNAEQMAAVQANTDLLTAIRNNYTQIEGGLILSTFFKLGALQKSGQWVESAGLKAMLSNTDEIAAYFGGTYAEALAGTKAGMTVIYHNGKLKALNAEITGEINATSGTFKNVLIQGSTRNAFTLVGDSFSTNFNDQVAMYSSSEGYNTEFSLPWDANQNGRRIVIANFFWNGSISRGNAVIKAPSGKYFFVDGVRKTKLNINRQVTELLGYGRGNTFYGWIVLNYVNAYCDRMYGSNLKVLAYGNVIGTSSGATIEAMALDGATLSVSRVSQGRYKITIPSSWFANKGDYMVWAQGCGWVDGANTNKSTAWIKASLIKKEINYFEVGLSDDETANDGQFMFMITNLREHNNWG